MAGAKPQTTHLLLQLVEGDPEAGRHLFALLYDELHARAQIEFRRESPGHTWQPTALVHEAFLRLVDQRRAQWQNRAHFCAVASQVMRRILVDHAREKKASRRGRGYQRVTLNPAVVKLTSGNIDDILFVDSLLAGLEATDPRQAQIVQMRFFAGLTVEEVAEVLGVSRRTVEGEWTMIRAILRSKAASRRE